MEGKSFDSMTDEEKSAATKTLLEFFDKKPELKDAQSDAFTKYLSKKRRWANRTQREAFLAGWAAKESHDKAEAAKTAAEESLVDYAKAATETPTEGAQ